MCTYHSSASHAVIGEVDRLHRRSRAIRLKNSALVLESAWKQPFTLLVIVIAPCFCTPRMTMHM